MAERLHLMLYIYIYICRYVHRSKKESATSPLKYLLRIVEIFAGLVQLNQLCFTAEDLLVPTHTKRSHDKEWETVHSRALLQNPPQLARQLSAGLHPNSPPGQAAVAVAPSGCWISQREVFGSSLSLLLPQRITEHLASQKL